MIDRTYLCLGLVVASTFAQAGVNEQFNYSDGLMGSVTGGVWNKWDPASSVDGSIVSGRAFMSVGTDVVREYGAELVGDGTVNYSFDFRVDNMLGSDGDLFFSPATMPYTTGQNYTDSLGFTVNSNLLGTAIRVWEGNTTTVVTVALTGGANYTINGSITRTGGTATYTSFLNGVSLRNGSFTLTDVRGLNGVEIYQSSGNVSNSTSFDNISLGPVPEPASMTCVGLGLLAMLRRRRK